MPNNLLSIYKTKNGIEVDVKFSKDTVWLSQKQMSVLFDKDVRTINEHIKNIFKEGELLEKSTIRNFRIVQNENGRKVTRNTTFYNLDVIISVGYRVKSLQGTQFRIWATRTLKNYLIKGYAVNKKLLNEQNSKLQELKETINFLQSKSTNKLLKGQEAELLNLLNNYSKTIKLLNDFDSNKLKTKKATKPKIILQYESIKKLIVNIKKDLVSKKLASNLFAVENSDKFKAILGNIYQTYGGVDLYYSLEEKAAHLLYFIIKDHPFVDGNKRMGAFLFVYFLDINNFLYKSSGEKKINDNALTALSLLVAISNPAEKELMIKLITNLII